MKTTSYDFFGTLTLEICGEGGRSVDQMRQMYDHFRAPTVDDPDVVVEMTRDDPDPDRVLGLPNQHYARDGREFVIQEGETFLKLDVDSNRLALSPAWEPFHAVYIVEFALRKRLAAEDRALLHASGVDIDGETTLFPAWRGAGKTNTLLSLLRAGGDFYSDDRLWVGADRSVQGYPTTINVGPHNLDSFPDITVEKDDDFKSRLLDFVKGTLREDGTVVEKGLILLAQYYFDDWGARNFVGPSELVPGASYAGTGEVDNVVVLDAAPSADRVSVERVPSSELLTETTTISLFEWNSRLRKYFTALDSLFADQQWSEQLDAVIADERRVFEELYADVGTYRAKIPREREWCRKGIDQQVVDAIRQLPDGVDDERTATADASVDGLRTS
jgi:hypothetical protein